MPARRRRLRILVIALELELINDKVSRKFYDGIVLSIRFETSQAGLGRI